MSLRIIGAALPRTGTLSLKFALEMLGLGRCYHMSELICDPSTRWRWAFARARPGLLDPLWDSYSATMDAPACMMWHPLAQRFPVAKVILTRRDPDRWFESVQETVGRPEQAKRVLTSPIAPAVLPHPPFGFRFDRKSMVRHFERYGETVRRTLPPDRLLEFEAKDGWGPLCAFLGVPEPEGPFPHVNDREAMRAVSDRMDVKSASFAEIQEATRRFIEQQRQSLLAR